MRIALTAVRIGRRGLDLALLALVAVVVSALLIARVVPMLTGAPVFVVGGGSMEPAIHLGSIAVDLPVAATSLAVGDIVSLTAGPQRAVFTHRITRLVPRDDGLWLETKGDANRTIDPSLVPASAVLGRVGLVVPILGVAVGVLGTASGLALIFMIAVGLLALAFALELVEEELTDDQRRRLPVRRHGILRRRRVQPGAAG